MKIKIALLSIMIGVLPTYTSMIEANDNTETSTVNVKVPKSIGPGSRIALVTPASWIDSMKVVKAMARLRERGYEPVPMQHVFGRVGSYTATPAERAVDLMAAFADPTIDAVLCTRGGYGCVQLLPLLNTTVFKENPKWLIGFSDISALHAMLTNAGVASIHGLMCAHIAEEPANDESTEHLFDILEQGLPKQYLLAGSGYNNPGTANGRVVGGNLLVVNGLSGTDNDVIDLCNDQDVILFFEDIGEKIYAIERVLMRLHQSGALKNAKGIVFGQFTDYKPDQDFNSMEEMIYHWLRQWGYYESGKPIVFDFPAGHVKKNYPVILGANAELVVTPSTVSLSYK